MPKIPKSRKHKKLKAIDPFNFKAQEELRLNSRGNLPPKSYEQEIPRAFKEIFMQKKSDPDEVDVQKSNKKSTQKNNYENDDNFVQRKWENDKQFLNRVERETNEFVSEKLFKIKFGISGPTANRDDEESVDEDGEKLSMSEKALLRDRKDPSAKFKHTVESSSNRKNSAKRKKRRKRKVDSLNVKDYVSFGERVDAPPDLGSITKKLTGRFVNKKGSKKDLHLTNMLSTDGGDKTLRFDLSAENRRYLTDRTIKCENERKRQQLTEERMKAIESYRAAKRRKAA